MPLLQSPFVVDLAIGATASLLPSRCAELGLRTMDVRRRAANIEQRARGEISQLDDLTPHDLATARIARWRYACATDAPRSHHQCTNPL